MASPRWGFFTSIDKVVSWSKSSYNIPTSLYPWDIVVSKTDANKVFLGGKGWNYTGVYQSNDGGVSFVPLDNNAPNAVYFDLFLSPDDAFLFAGTSEGPYVYSFADTTWYFLGNPNTPYVEHRSVEYIKKKVLFALAPMVEGYGILK